MADTTVVIDDELSITLTEDVIALLKLFNASGLRHPKTAQPEFLGNDLVLTFAKTGTVTISSNGTHLWQFADDPTMVFDDRGLG